MKGFKYPLRSVGADDERIAALVIARNRERATDKLMSALFTPTKNEHKDDEDEHT